MSQTMWRVSNGDRTDGAVNVVCTSLGDLNAGWFLTHDTSGCGNDLDQALLDATVLPIPSGGLPLPAAFATRLQQSGGRGVLLVEGAGASTAPLLLEAVLANGTVLASVELPLRVAPVEQMYDRLSLRGGGSTLTAGNAVPPMATAHGHFVFVHGYNVNVEDARYWAADIFKRMYQSGMNTRFTAVTWDGEESQVYFPALGFGRRSPDYYANVRNAFEAAPRLSAAVGALQGEPKVIAAHSLGNMLVSAAIQDHALAVDKFFMLNAAVAAACYDVTLYDTNSQNPMVHDDWRAYNSETWSARWHGLFQGQQNDDRAILTWTNRFQAVLPVAYNYYSSGDEVFEVFPTTPTPLTGYELASPNIRYSVGRYSWQKQELFKGRTASSDLLASWLTRSDQAGWGFRGEFVGDPPPFYRTYTAAEANALTVEELRSSPVFHHNPPEMFASVITPTNRTSLLASAIPALSPATGSQLICPDQVENINMNSLPRPNGWWRTGHYIYPELDNRWLHCDLKNAAFFYVHQLFVYVVNSAGVK